MKLFAAASQPIGVLVADSNRMQAQLLTSALRRRSEFRITQCSLDSASILQAANARAPGVALLSLNAMADVQETVTILHRFHRSHPLIPKVLLVESCDRDLVVSAFRAGVRGIFSMTDSHLRLLCKCISRVAAGQVWANTDQLNHLLELVSEVPSLRVLNSQGSNLLTPREEQVVALVAEGLSNRQIAVELNLSEHTIKKYLFRIFEKLGVSTRVELVLYAVNHGDPRHAQYLASRILPSAQIG
jgi:DNA-binding NarL/FixJ family response regulator